MPLHDFKFIKFSNNKNSIMRYFYSITNYPSYSGSAYNHLTTFNPNMQKANLLKRPIQLNSYQMVHTLLMKSGNNIFNNFDIDMRIKKTKSNKDNFRNYSTKYHTQNDKLVMLNINNKLNKLNSDFANSQKKMRQVSENSNELKQETIKLKLTISNLKSTMENSLIDKIKSLENKLIMVNNTLTKHASSTRTNFKTVSTTVNQIMNQTKKPELISFVDRRRDEFKKFKDRWVDPFLKTVTDFIGSPLQIASYFAIYLTLLILSAEILAEILAKYLLDDDEHQIPLDHMIPNKAIKELERIFLSYHCLDEGGISSYEIQTNQSILSVIITGGFGTGKTLTATSFLATYKTKIPGADAYIIDCKDEASFYNSIIKMARSHGMSQICGYNLDYESALNYLEKNLATNWLFIFDNLQNIELIKNVDSFIAYLRNNRLNQGNIIFIASNGDKIREIISKNNYINLHSKDINLNDYARYGFDEQDALRLLESLIKSAYIDEKLSFTQRFFKDTKLFNYFNPGYPHSDKNLKQELVRYLGYSPHAISLAAAYISAEYARTKQRPAQLITTYLQLLSKKLNMPEGISPFNLPSYLEDKLDKRPDQYEQVSKACYKIALEKIDELIESSNQEQAKIAKAAKSIIPLLSILSPKSIYMNYIEAYLKIHKKAHFSDSEIQSLVEFVCSYGLLKRYYINKNKAASHTYTRFYVDDAIREAYIELSEIDDNSSPDKKSTYKMQEYIENILKFISTGFHDSDFDKKANSKIQENIKDIIKFIRAGFRIDNPYLEPKGYLSNLNHSGEYYWQYVLHCLNLVNISNRFNGNSQDKIIELFEFVNPVMNILMQSGYILEYNLFYDEINKIVNKRLEINELDQLIKNSSNFNLKDFIENDILIVDEALTQFYEKLYSINTRLPILYAQYIYYHARRIFKTEMLEEECKKCIGGLVLANKLRQIIDKKIEKNKKYLEDMPYDSLSFKRDGLGFLAIKDNLNTELVESFYTNLASKNDYINRAICFRYIAQAKLNKVYEMLSTENDKKDYMEHLLSEADDSLNKFKKIISNTSKRDKRLTKASRFYLMKAEIAELKTRLNKKEFDYQAQCNTALHNYIKFLNKATGDQKPDHVLALKVIAKIRFDLMKANQLAGKDEQMNVLNAINDCIKIQKQITVSKYEESLIKSYKLKASTLLHAENYSEAKDIIETLLSALNEKKKEHSSNAEYIEQEIKELKIILNDVQQKIEQNIEQNYERTLRI